MSNRSSWFFRLLAGFTLCLVLWSCSNSEGSSPTEPGPSGSRRILAVPYVSQQTPVWCWAAVSEMVFRYYRRPGTQCEILSAWFHFNCCAAAQYCLSTASIQQIRETLGANGLRSTAVAGPVPFQVLAAEIDAGRPLILGYRGSFAGHVVVLYGYDQANNVYIHDPYYGSFVVPYGASFSYGGQLLWSDTIGGIGP